MALTNLRHGSIETVYASGARTATPPVAEFVCADPAIRGIVIFVDVTDLAATPDVDPTIKVTGRSAAAWVTLKAFTPITDVTGIGLYAYFIYPGITDLDLADLVADEVVAYPIPTHFELSMVHNDADSITYSVELQCLR